MMLNRGRAARHGPPPQSLRCCAASPALAAWSAAAGPSSRRKWLEGAKEQPTEVSSRLGL
jgi:hypothetical protein